MADDPSIPVLPPPPGGPPHGPPDGKGGKAPVLCGDIDLRIGRDGTWYYHGSPIGRKELVRLFASVLSRDSRGDFWLITPAEKCRVVVEDAPFIAVELSRRGAGRDQVLILRSNVDDTVTVDRDHPIRVETDAATGEPSPYVLVRDRLEARISRAVFYELVDLGRTGEAGGKSVFGVWSSGTFFSLSSVPWGSLDLAP